MAIEKVRSKRDLTNMNKVMTETTHDLKSFCNIRLLAPIDKPDPGIDTSGRRQADALLRVAADKYKT
eukprot:2622336-Lingulodinium_polyedra.AAC.1